MGLLIKIIHQSFLQATQQLLGNKLRTFLSLLGISFGIWSVISVFAAVSSLSNQISSSLSKLGDDVIYIQKQPWMNTSLEEYLKNRKRPNITYKDFKVVQERLTSADLVTFQCFIGQRTIEYKSSNVEGAFTIAPTYDYAETFKIPFSNGRYFTERESNSGQNILVLGNQVAQELFGSLDPVGRKVKFLNRKMTIVGVIEQSKDELINPTNFDECVLIPYETARKLMNIDYNTVWQTYINVKPKPGISKEDFEDDVIGVLRAQRRLKPREKNNFALNKVSMFASALEEMSGRLNVVGFLIGIFSLIVGMISVANIMFVSVKERTSLIGLKMAIGAHRNTILLEFLIEAVVLCIIGGILGLIMVFFTSLIISAASTFDFVLSFNNILLGLIISIITGMVAGIIPAYSASQMEPVEALRS